MFEITPACKRKFQSVNLKGDFCDLSFRSITLRPSVYLLCLLWLVHGAALLSFFCLYYVLDFSIVLLSVLQFLCLGSFFYYAFGYKRALGGRLCYENMQWFWFDRMGRRTTLKFNGALLWPNLVVLYLCTATGAGRTVVIFSDGVDADELRRLRVFLRL